MKVAFRADASTEIGHGHVMRCLSLASALRDQGTQSLFVCRRLDGHLFERIERAGFQVHALSPESLSAAQDAQQTRLALRALGATVDWLVVDHYRLDASYEHSLRDCTRRILVIDDLANRQHDCDVLLDQNIVADAATRHVDSVPSDCVLLLGPQYALLQPVYRDLRESTPARRGHARRILISWGGTDTAELTGRALTALLESGRSDLTIDVVMSSASPQSEAVRRLAEAHENVRVHCDLPTLAPLMAQADLALGAIGTTTWERLCLGLPTIAIAVADNQREIAEELGRRGLVVYLGRSDQVSDAQMARAIDVALAADISDWSARCRAVVDGKGAERVAALIHARPTLHARAVNRGDEALLLEWANDPLTRSNAFNSHAISAQEHHTWFAQRLADSECRFFMLAAQDGECVGQVRFDRLATGWRISYSVAPRLRGRGLGRAVLATALRRLAQEVPDEEVFGEVKEGNAASCRVFEALGFDKSTTAGVVEYRSLLSAFARQIPA